MCPPPSAVISGVMPRGGPPPHLRSVIQEPEEQVGADVGDPVQNRPAVAAGRLDASTTLQEKTAPPLRLSPSVTRVSAGNRPRPDAAISGVVPCSVAPSAGRRPTPPTPASRRGCRPWPRDDSPYSRVPDRPAVRRRPPEREDYRLSSRGVASADRLARRYPPNER